jgi:flagellar hook-basal body complex protein FliE
MCVFRPVYCITCAGNDSHEGESIVERMKREKEEQMQREKNEREEQERAQANKGKSKDKLLKASVEEAATEQENAKTKTVRTEEDEFGGFNDEDIDDMDALTAAKRAFVTPLHPHPYRAFIDFQVSFIVVLLLFLFESKRFNVNFFPA